MRAVPYSARQVLPHERTLTGPKLDRIALSRATRAMLSPQFMLYSDPERRLEADLASGAWDAAHGHLRGQAEFEGSLRLIISEPAPLVAQRRVEARGRA